MGLTMPTLQRGFHCSLSLRACTLILASLSLVVSLFTIVISDVIVWLGTMNPTAALSDFDTGDEREAEGDDADVTALKDALQDLHTFLIISIVFDSINLIMCTADIICLCLLIYGAAKRRAAFIRPWLFLGIAWAIFDVVYCVVHWAIGMHLFYTMGAILHFPLVVYLWLVAANLHLECSEEAARCASSPVSMSTLITDGAGLDDEPSVAYGVLDKEYP